MRLTIFWLSAALVAAAPAFAANGDICKTDFRLAGEQAIEAIVAACQPGDAITFRSPPTAGTGHQPQDPAEKRLCEPSGPAIMQSAGRDFNSGFLITCAMRKQPRQR